MKKELVERLCCPMCSNKLEMVTFDTDQRDSIREGVLTCSRCKLWHPILNFVPVLLTFPTRLHSEFEKAHKEQLAALLPCVAPNRTPLQGEESAQETFTEQWAP